MRTILTTLKPSQTEAVINKDLVGPPGVRQRIETVVNREGQQKNADERFADRTPREFIVYVQFGKVATEGVVKDGESFLMLQPDATDMQIRIGMYKTAVFNKNSANELSSIKYDCIASSPREALRSFHQEVVPIIDWLCFLLNVPIHFAYTNVTDVRNEIQSTEFRGLHEPVLVPNHSQSNYRELDAVFSWYREAKNSSSDFYKFFCYCKILEGLYGAVLPLIKKRAKTNGTKLTVRKSAVPDTPKLQGPYRQYIGKSIPDFYYRVLQPKYRNAVAHFMLDTGGVLNASDSQHLSMYEEVVYVSQLCVRQCIEDFRQMLKEVYFVAHAKS